MCARYTLTKEQKKIMASYQVKLPDDYAPNYNIAPTQNSLVITSDEPDTAQLMHFGLVPYWAQSTKLDFSTMNARSEEVASKKTYSPLLEKHKTCLVLTDGFYEWDKKTGDTLPYRFVLNDRDLFAFAGLWSQWKDKITGDVYRSFTIMTTRANEIVGKVHSPKFRMPVILDKKEESLWLSKDLSVDQLLSLCNPYPDDLMNSYRVAKEVNKVANNNSELILPLNRQ